MVEILLSLALIALFGSGFGVTLSTFFAKERLKSELALIKNKASQAEKIALLMQSEVTLLVEPTKKGFDIALKTDAPLAPSLKSALEKPAHLKEIEGFRLNGRKTAKLEIAFPLTEETELLEVRLERGKEEKILENRHNYELRTYPQEILSPC